MSKESTDEPIQGHREGDAPSIRIESAEGVTTFPGLNGDAESERARAFIRRRLTEIPTERDTGSANRSKRASSEP